MAGERRTKDAVNTHSARGVPERLGVYLQQGRPALLLTVDEEDYPHAAYTWVVARDTMCLRFIADQGSMTLDNLRREGRAAIQIVGPRRVLFLVKGVTRIIKERIEAAPFHMVMGEMQVLEARDQSFSGVSVSPLKYTWSGDRRKEMLVVEQAIFLELREWMAETTERLI